MVTESVLGAGLCCAHTSSCNSGQSHSEVPGPALPLCLEYAHSRERGVARLCKHPSSSRGVVGQSPELGQVAQQAHAEQAGGWQRVSFLQMG